MGVQFDGSEGKEFYESLRELQSSLRETLKVGIEMPAVEKELAIVESLISACQTSGHLNEQDASLESLACIKCAALCWILRLESAKAKQASSRARQALDQKIYWIVQRYFVAQPYNGIRLLAAVRDMVAQRGQSSPRTQPPYGPRIDVSGSLKEIRHST